MGPRRRCDRQRDYFDYECLLHTASFCHPPPATCLLFAGFDPALFEVLLPVLRPWTSEIIDEARLARNQFCRASVRTIHDRALHATLDEVEPPFRIVEP